MTTTVTFDEFVRAFPRWAQSVAVAPSGCWVWARPLGWGGYAQARIGGRKVYVHREVYIALVGPLPDDRPQLDHLCRVRHCLCPNHLEPVTASENVRRGDRPAGHVAEMAAKTHCRNGHEYTDATTSVRRGRFRRCLICERECNKRHYARNVERIRARRKKVAS
jgi:hypothetical protein